ncbi:hypothetical protein HYQ46_007115 [Verticillium longisporum]|nr:hypothetical protein HYQ46_007115 [Verticillium longisporum]
MFRGHAGGPLSCVSRTLWLGHRPCHPCLVTRRSLSLSLASPCLSPTVRAHAVFPTLGHNGAAVQIIAFHCDVHVE